MPSRASRDQEYFPPGLDDFRRRRDPLDRLIERKIEWIAGRRRDGRVHRFPELMRHGRGNEPDSLGVRFFGISGKNTRDAAVAGDGHIQHEVVAGHARDFDQFRMHGIAFDQAFNSSGIAHEPGAVNRLYGVLVRASRRDQFSPSREAEHEMWFDQSAGEVEIGGHEPLVDVDGGAGSGRAQVPVLAQLTRMMVDDVVAARDRGRQYFRDLGVGGGPVKAGGNDDGGRGARNAGTLRRLRATAAT